jgi:micrococcal nuclease
MAARYHELIEPGPFNPLEGADINFTLVKEGLAWCYDRYVRDRNCYDHQNKAKEQGLGLWSDTNPIPPWEWRRGNR